ncbi:DUF4245 domain-containing protein [Arthrobacter psychrolactophilus]|uniref:DUF4245 domain-containing protein n=1 Tax=Arthrobacter psychrolactophilus TaxID=92442 RepID=A0A2V5IQD4_9MICC|nr:DUF4245 domain-containing protein [Arthrobacter psychrolactophilus]PYI38778.1 DUF4245 domain-containing protein [Arthrobacter psychrolactophilus]
MSESSPTPTVKPVIAAGAAKRANASIIGMLLAMFSTVAIVLAVVWLNPQQKADGYRVAIDVPAVAANAAGPAGFSPVAPTLPEGWSANYARWNPPGTDGVAFWDVGYVTGSNTFIALRQTITANPTWVAAQSSNAPVTGSRTIDGHDWELRDKPKGDRSLVLTSGSTTIILTGAADFKDFDILATGATKQLAADAAATANAASTPSTKVGK